ncbi:hypothetical protein NKG05_28200 [Oerskovia sp. M15]
MQRPGTGADLIDLYAGHVDPTDPGVNPPINPDLLMAFRSASRDTGYPGGWRARRGPRLPWPRGRPGARAGTANAKGRAPHPPRFAVVDALDADGLLPAIFFIFSRAGCEAAVTQCLAAGLRLTTPPRRRRSGPWSRSAAPRCPPRTSTSSGTGRGASRWPVVSPPTMPGCCRSSRRSSSTCSAGAWSRSSSRPRRSRSASTCPPARSCSRSSSSGTAPRTST